MKRFSVLVSVCVIVVLIPASCYILDRNRNPDLWNATIVNHTFDHLRVTKGGLVGEYVDIMPGEFKKWPGKIYRPTSIHSFKGRKKNNKAIYPKHIKVNYGTLFREANVNVVFVE